MSDPLELELQTVVSHYVVLGMDPGPLEEHPALFTSEPPLQPVQLILRVTWLVRVKQSLSFL